MMDICAALPFRPENPKTRLSGILTEAERTAFADAMLHDVVSALRDAEIPVTILSTAEYACEGASVAVRNEGLNEALNRFLSDSGKPVLIIMSDLPLVTRETILRVVSTEKDIAVVPGTGGGTNILFIRNPKAYHVQYYGYSFKRHLEIAEQLNMTVDVIDSLRMSTDVDEPEDLVELLIHGNGSAKRWLEENGFSLCAEDGRVSVKRGETRIV